MVDETPQVLSVAVATESTGHYVSFDCDLQYALNNPLDLINDDRITFAGPYQLVAEVAIYRPHEDAEPSPLDPDEEVLVYDMYGPHGIHRLGTGYESTAEVREWIDAELEAEADGVYAIGYVAAE